VSAPGELTAADQRAVLIALFGIESVIDPTEAKDHE
jgi:hypothetical protein